MVVDMHALITSEFEDYVVQGCASLRHVFKVFGASLKSTRDTKAADARADPVLAERVELSNVCWDSIAKCCQQLRDNMAAGGRVGSSAREVLALYRRIGL